MLWALIVILLLLGLLGGWKVSGLLYLLCVAAVVVLVIQLLTGRRAI